MFFTSNIQAKISIGILDTGFCNKKKLSISSNIKLLPSIDITNSVKMDCKSIDYSNKRFHGHFVVDTIIKLIKMHQISEFIEIQPYIIFDKFKIQKKKYWDLAISHAEKKSINILIIAAGIPISNNKNKNNINFSGTLFLSSGNWGGKIKKNKELWPQYLDQPNMLIIGDYFKDDKLDIINKSVMHKNIISYYFPSKIGELSLSGSSLAVTLASIKMIKLCRNSIISTNKIKMCLKSHSKMLKIDKKTTPYLTY